jgi:hypothetical protein
LAASEGNGFNPFRVLKTAGASPLHPHKNDAPFIPALPDGALCRGFCGCDHGYISIKELGPVSCELNKKGVIREEER